VITIISLTFKNLGIFNWWGSNRFDIGFKEFNRIPPKDREDHLDEAVQRFEDAYNSSPAHSGHIGNQVKHKFVLKLGRTRAKLYVKKEGSNDRGRLYAFIDINMEDPERYGGMMKPATYKAPEPKKYIRAHLFSKDPLRGATWYGPDYMDGGKKDSESKRIRDNWFREAFAEESKWGV
jgi:hypothetical protein